MLRVAQISDTSRPRPGAGTRRVSSGGRAGMRDLAGARARRLCRNCGYPVDKRRLRGITIDILWTEKES